MRLIPLVILLAFAACSPKLHTLPMQVQSLGSDDILAGARLVDDDLHVDVVFLNNKYLHAALAYGFTLFVDGDPDLTRGFGITYPLGGDGSLAERRASAALMQRPDKRTDPVFTAVDTRLLAAQNLHLGLDDTTAFLRIRYRIPLTSNRAKPYGIDPKGDRIRLGFEIKPGRLEETAGMNPMMQGQDRVGRGTVRTPRGTYYADDELAQAMRRSLIGEYVKWIEIRVP
jgi:hypothetical protein